MGHIILRQVYPGTLSIKSGESRLKGAKDVFGFLIDSQIFKPSWLVGWLVGWVGGWLVGWLMTTHGCPTSWDVHQGRRPDGWWQLMTMCFLSGAEQTFPNLSHGRTPTPPRNRYTTIHKFLPKSMQILKPWWQRVGLHSSPKPALQKTLLASGATGEFLAPPRCL